MTDNDSHPEVRLESPEVAARTVLFTALTVLAFVGLSIASARVYYVWQIRGPVNVAPKMFGAPRLQINDAADLAKFEEQQRAQLKSYAWVDRDRGIIQIPIDRAIALIAAKGAHAYEPIGPLTTTVKSGSKTTP